MGRGHNPPLITTSHTPPSWDITTGHHYGTSLRDITTGHHYGTSLRDITMGHHYGTSLRDITGRHYGTFGTSLRDVRDVTTGRSGRHYGTSLRDIPLVKNREGNGKNKFLVKPNHFFLFKSDSQEMRQTRTS